jgi:hypothetical protein
VTNVILVNNALNRQSSSGRLRWRNGKDCSYGCHFGRWSTVGAAPGRIGSIISENNPEEFVAEGSGG